MASSDAHHCTPTIFYGAVINPISLTCYSTLLQCLLSIDPSGKIEWMIDNVEQHKLQEILASKKLVDVNIIYLKDGEFLMPGFIDTHTVRIIFFLSDSTRFRCPTFLPHSTRLNSRS